MKVAVPTIDGLKIADIFENAGAFLVMTFKAGEITNQELRKLKFSEIINFEESFQDKLQDCQYVFVREIDQENCDTLKELEIQCIKTKESLISMIADHFKEEVLVNVPEKVAVLRPVRASK